MFLFFLLLCCCCLDSCDRWQGQFSFLLIIIDQLMFLPPSTAEGLQSLPNTWIHHKVTERSGSIVTKLPQERSWAILNLKKPSKYSFLSLLVVFINQRLGAAHFNTWVKNCFFLIFVLQDFDAKMAKICNFWAYSQMLVDPKNPG